MNVYMNVVRRFFSAFVAVVGGILFLFGVVGVAGALLGALDPVEAQLSNDPDPFGPPRSSLAYGGMAGVYLFMAVGGFFMIRWVKKSGVGTRQGAPVDLRLVLTAALICLMPSCASRVFNEPQDATFRFDRGSVTGTSTEEKVFSLLRRIHPQPSRFTVTKIVRIDGVPACGMGAMLTVFTLGLVPTSLPANYYATVQGISNSRTETRRYFLVMHTWQGAMIGLIPSISEEKKLAKALAGAIRDDRRSQLESRVAKHK